MSILDDERHELFAQNLAKGTPQSKAYVAAGFEASTPQSIRVNAHRLSRKAAVMKRIVEIQEAGARKAEREIGVTKGRVLQMLLDSYEMATERKQMGPAVRAVELMGKTIGLFTDKVEFRGGILDELTFEQLDAIAEAAAAEEARRAACGGEPGSQIEAERKLISQGAGR